MVDNQFMPHWPTSRIVKKPWVGLTDNDKEKCLAVREDRGWHGVLDAVEAKLREMNGG